MTNLVAETVYEVEVGEGDGWVKKATIRNIGEDMNMFHFERIPRNFLIGRGSIFSSQ